MQKNAETMQNAKHLAARAVMAYRAEFPVELLSVVTESSTQSGIICNWTQQRETYSNDDKLVKRGFAFVYIGTILDQSVDSAGRAISDAFRKELASDMNAAIEARQIATEWGLASSINDTNPFAHSGYKLASRLLRTDHSLIGSLAEELCVKETINKEQLKAWLDEHARPLSLEELESTKTY